MKGKRGNKIHKYVFSLRQHLSFSCFLLILTTENRERNLTFWRSPALVECGMCSRWKTKSSSICNANLCTYTMRKHFNSPLSYTTCLLLGFSVIPRTSNPPQQLQRWASAGKKYIVRRWEERWAWRGRLKFIYSIYVLFSYAFY